MKYAVLIALLLAGCSTTVPVARKFPEVPDTIMQGCPDLEKLNSGAKLSDVAKSVTHNYATYHECSSKHDAFIEWYSTQKKIFEEVK